MVDGANFDPRQENLPDGVVSFACRLDSESETLLEECRVQLSPAEAARADRFRFQRDRARYIRGRAFIRTELGRWLGKAPSTLVLEEATGGKPRLAGSGPEFNLSHSGDLAVLAISDCGPVGIDVELLDRRVDVENLAQSVFTRAETEAILALPQAARLARFLTFWTAKEARMKLTGEGMRLEPRQISLDLSGGWPVGYLRPALPAARVFFARPSHERAICCLSLLG